MRQVSAPSTDVCNDWQQNDSVRHRATRSREFCRFWCWGTQQSVWRSGGATGPAARRVDVDANYALCKVWCGYFHKPNLTCGFSFATNRGFFCCLFIHLSHVQVGDGVSVQNRLAISDAPRPCYLSAATTGYRHPLPAPASKANAAKSRQQEPDACGKWDYCW